MTEQQINEGVKEIVLTLLSLAATAYETDYVLKQLNKRPEPTEEKIEALKIADTKIQDSKFDKMANKLLNYYQNQVKVELPSRPYPKQAEQSNLVEFIRQHEDFSPVPYWDFKQYSIGYGTKALPTDKSISEEEAKQRLALTVKKHKDAVINAGKKWGYNWSPNQIDALTSFRYNVGSLGMLTNNGTRTNSEIARKILEYDKAGGKPLKGLTKRRKHEQLMFVRK